MSQISHFFSPHKDFSVPELSSAVCEANLGSRPLQEPRSCSEMFATATKNFAEEVDPDGGLIPVSSLKDSISVMSVVVKRKKFWLWQKPKYIPTGFKLSDLLTGDAPLTPGELG